MGLAPTWSCGAAHDGFANFFNCYRTKSIKADQVWCIHTRWFIIIIILFFLLKYLCTDVSNFIRSIICKAIWEIFSWCEWLKFRLWYTLEKVIHNSEERFWVRTFNNGILIKFCFRSSYWLLHFAAMVFENVSMTTQCDSIFVLLFYVLALQA